MQNFYCLFRENGISAIPVNEGLTDYKRVNITARKGICPISKHRAGFYTTNPDLFPAIVELSNTVTL